MTAPSPAHGAHAGERDTGSIQAIVAAMYDAVSFAPGGSPDWHRLRTLFLDRARLIPPQVGDPPVLHVLEFDAWMTESNAFLDGPGAEIRARGFREAELAGRSEAFGDVAHVFSTYGSYYRDQDEPFARGINSVQLVRQGGRWWVATILWDLERPGRPIPPAYLPPDAR